MPEPEPEMIVPLALGKMPAEIEEVGIVGKGRLDKEAL